MRRFASLILVVLLVGCAAAPQTDRQRLAAAEIAFTEAVNELAFARDTGVMTQEQIDRLRPTIQHTAAALDAARTAILQGRPSGTALDVAQAGIRALIAARTKGGG